MPETHVPAPPCPLPNTSQDPFWDLWLGYRGKLLQRCLTWTNGNLADAEDLLGDVMLKAREKLAAATQPVKNRTAWLNRIAFNCFVDFYRHRQYLDWSLGTVDMDQFQDGMGVTWGPKAEHQLIQADTLRHVLGYATGLSPNLKRPFVLFFIKEEPYSVVAQSCGISQDNARKRVQLARGQLKQKLAKMERHPTPKVQTQKNRLMGGSL